jgi:hypothetical protein
MNRNIALAAIFAATVSGNALADDITIDTTPFTSTMTRAEVRAELNQFKQAGTSPWAIQYNPLASFKSTVSSEAVTAQDLASRGEVAAFNGEDSGSSYLALTRVPTGGATLAGYPRNSAE